VVSAGCGGTRSSGGNDTAATPGTVSSGVNSTATTRAKAVKFAECMRANGVSDFPDPNASGEFPSYGVSVSPAVWKKAGAACKALQPPGTLSAKLTPAQESAALKFAQCIRENGVPDFPDPVTWEQPRRLQPSERRGLLRGPDQLLRAGRPEAMSAGDDACERGRDCEQHRILVATE